MEDQEPQFVIKAKSFFVGFFANNKILIYVNFKN